MPRTLTFLKENNLTVRDLSELSNISSSTLSETFKRPIKNGVFKLLWPYLKLTHKSLDDVAKYLISGPWKLKINNKDQSIQNVVIPDKKAFIIIKSTVVPECMEGWEPSSNDIHGLVREYYHPSLDIIKDVKDAKQKFEMRDVRDRSYD